jgi:hypothetical protein
MSQQGEHRVNQMSAIRYGHFLQVVTLNDDVSVLALEFCGHDDSLAARMAAP